MSENNSSVLPSTDSPPDPPEIDFDHNSPEVAQDRVTAFSEIRDRCPVAFSTQHDGFYVLADWESVHDAAADPKRFSSQPRALIPMYPENMGMLDLDPPQGTEVRRGLSALFSKAAAESTRPRVRELVDERIDAFIERGRADLVRELTGPVPAAMTAEGLGLPLEHADEWAAVFHDLLGGGLETEAEMDAVLARLGTLLTNLSDIIDERAVTPSDDWLSALLALEIGGQPMSKSEVLQNAHLLFSGGVDTTSAAVTWALVHLHRDHALRDRLREEPDLMSTTIEEFLRYYSIFVGSARTVTADTELSGVALEGGRRALLTWASANRDPRVFPEPDTFSPDRTPNRHLAFGHGNHKCLGQHLARIQMEVILTTVLERFPDYVVDEAAINMYKGGIVNGLRGVHVTFTPGERVAGVGNLRRLD